MAVKNREAKEKGAADATHCDLEATVKRLAEIVAINTRTSKPGDDNSANHWKCLNLIKQQAEDLGFKTEVHDAKEYAGDGISRPNLVIKHDVGAKKTRLFICHYDTIETLQGWTKTELNDPFRLTRGEIDGEPAWFGNGACDDKGQLQATLDGLRRLKESGKAKCNTHLVVTCDEELGGPNGAGFLLAKGIIRGEEAVFVDASDGIFAAATGVLFADVVVREEGTQDAVSAIRKLVGYAKELEKTRVSKFRLHWAEQKDAEKEFVWGRFNLTRIDGRQDGYGIWGDGAVTATFTVKAGNSKNKIPASCTVECRFEFEASADSFAGKVPGADVHAGITAFLGPLEGRNFTTLESEHLPNGRIREISTFNSVVEGAGCHAGYPFRSKRRAIEAALGLVHGLNKKFGIETRNGEWKLSFDLRTIPEETLEEAKSALREYAKKSIPRKLAEVEVGFDEKVFNLGYNPDGLDANDLTRLAEHFGATEVVASLGAADIQFYRKGQAGEYAEDGSKVYPVSTGANIEVSHAHAADENIRERDLARISDFVFELGKKEPLAWDKRRPLKEHVPAILG